MAEEEEDDTTTISLRINSDQLDRWDKVCDPTADGPYLYSDRSKLIRKSVETQIFEESNDSPSEVNVDIEPIEDRIDSLENDMRDVKGTLDEISTMTAYLVDLHGESGVDITSDVYQSLPSFNSIHDAEQELRENINQLEDGDAERTEQLGWRKDFLAKFNAYGRNDVYSALDKLATDVDTVRQITIDGETFVFEVEE